MDKNTFFLLPKLSQNMLEILEDDEYYDITIEVGNDPHVKIFRAHMNILYYRSPYFRKVLSYNRKKNDETLVHVKLSNLSPENFQVILRYIYSGRLSLEGFDASEIVKTLVIANELGLQELITYLQSILIENNEKWSDEGLHLVYQTSLESESFLVLKKVFTELISNEPETFFESPYFVSASKKVLISLIQNDNLNMSASKVWDYVLKWGLAQNPNLSSDPSSYSQDDYNSLKGTLKELIPLIKFLSFASKEFMEKVYPYKKIIPEELFDNTIKCLTAEYDKKINFKSSIISFQHAEIISKWIDKLEITDETAASYDFKLLVSLRGELSGNLFHELCDNKFPTVTIIKVEGSDEILGGYNPIKWESNRILFYGETKDSFIFSFKDKNDLNNHILSRVMNKKHATYNRMNHGPGFGYSDLYISPLYGANRCVMSDYEKPIRETNVSFNVEICEIFLLTKN